MARMKTSLTKAALGAAAAGAMALSATPAMARDHWDDDDGIGAGEIIAGAVIIGGLAAILSSGDDDRYDRYDRYDNRRYGRHYRRYGGSRQAVNRCVRAVERRGGRYGRINVTHITDIDRERRGYEVKGRVVEYDRYRSRWDRGDRYDRGRFKCDVRYGRIRDIDIRGL